LVPGADVPSTAIGIQPSNRERQPERTKDLRSPPPPGCRVGPENKHGGSPRSRLFAHLPTDDIFGSSDTD